MRTGAIDEQGDAGAHVERRDRVPAFPGDAQQLPARHQQAHVRCPAREPGDDVGAGRQELFEVVEHEERRSIAEVRVERIADGSLR